MEIEKIIPDENDLFLSSPITMDTLDPAFFESRRYNPGVRMEIDYTNDFIKTFTDIDLDPVTGEGDVKVTGVQKNGLGNTEEEIEYDETGQPYAVKRMLYDAYGRMIALTDPDPGAKLPDYHIYDRDFHLLHTIERYDRTWILLYDDLG